MPCCNPYDSKWSQELLSRSIETANRLHTPDSVTPSIFSKDLPPALLPTGSILVKGGMRFMVDARRSLSPFLKAMLTEGPNSPLSKCFWTDEEMEILKSKSR